MRRPRLPGLRAWTAAALLAAPGVYGTGASELVLQVQAGLATPVQAAALAGALSRASGLEVTAVVGASALSHWRALRRGTPVAGVMEEAHFLDHRLAREEVVLLAQALPEARFAVIVAPGTLVSSPSDLRTRRVAVASPPALAALRLLQLFPDPLQAPVLVPLRGPEPVGQWIQAGRVDGAMLDIQRAEAIPGLRTVLVTDALPGPGVAVHTGVAAARRRALREALLGLADSTDGAAALAALGLAGFQAAARTDYQGASRLLRGTWPGP